MASFLRFSDKPFSSIRVFIILYDFQQQHKSMDSTNACGPPTVTNIFPLGPPQIPGLNSNSSEQPFILFSSWDALAFRIIGFKEAAILPLLIK